eukprot:14368162-Alexandrium_andersonii.AAC.1
MAAAPLGRPLRRVAPEGQRQMANTTCSGLDQFEAFSGAFRGLPPPRPRAALPGALLPPKASSLAPLVRRRRQFPEVPRL